MNTAITSLTTEQLIDACDRQGSRVSTTQLGRWVRAGLIPSSLRRRHGRGRGQGAEWLWAAECQERVLLIAQTLTKGDPSLQKAAHVLAAAGYPLDAICLRQILLDELTVVERFMARRQPSLINERSADDTRRRLKRNMRRWVADMPDELFQRFYLYMGAIFGVISLEETDTLPFFHHMQEIISIPAIRQRLQIVEDTWLLTKYEQVSQALPAMATLMLAMFNMMLPALAERAQRQKPGQPFPIGIDTEKLLAGMRQEGSLVLVARENPIGELRLILTILLAAFPLTEEEVLSQWAKALGELFGGLMKYLNIPAKQAAMLDFPGLTIDEA